MKNLILTAIIAASSMIIATPNAEAGSCKPVVNYSCKKPVVYKVKTVEVNRCRQQYMAYDKCGRQVCYWVTVITFRDVYSNGQTRTWTRTV